MSDREPGTGGGRPRLTPLRVVVWILVAGLGVFLLVSGAAGILAKG